MQSNHPQPRMRMMGRPQDEIGIDSGVRARGGGMDRWLRFVSGVPLLRRVAGLLTSGRYVVRGDSMRPTLEPGQHLLVARFYARPGRSRGDLVVVCDPRESGRRHLKRVVGMPGEEVRMLDGTLFVDGVALSESYLGGLPASVGLGDRSWSLGRGEYFLLGDNRAHSTDSREHGPVSEDLIVGGAWFRYWPLLKWGRVG